MKSNVNNFVELIKKNLDKKEDNNINILIDIQFPNIEIINYINKYTTIEIYKDGNKIQFIGNKLELDNLYNYLNDSEDLIKLIEDLINSIDYKIMFQSISNIEEFIKYDYPFLKKDLELNLFLYKLIKTNIEHLYENPNKIIGYNSIDDEGAIALGYDYDYEVTNYKTTLYNYFHYYISNSSDRKKYNQVLQQNKKLINNIFPNNQYLLNYLSEALTNDVSIFDGVISIKQEVIIKFKGKQKVIINFLKSQKGKGGVSEDTLISVAKINGKDPKKALQQNIKIIRKKISDNNLKGQVVINYNRSTKSYQIKY